MPPETVATLAKVPPGTYSFDDQMDDYGPGTEPVRFSVDVTFDPGGLSTFENTSVVTADSPALTPRQKLAGLDRMEAGLTGPGPATAHHRLAVVLQLPLSCASDRVHPVSNNTCKPDRA